MKKKLLCLLLVLIMPVMVLAGCNYEDVQSNKVGKEYNIGSLTFVKIEQSGAFCILVDKDTRVMYLFNRDAYQGGLTPLLNADGTPMLWEGEL